jgi:hypothetical protein
MFEPKQTTITIFGADAVATRAWWQDFASRAIVWRVGHEAERIDAIEFVADYCADQNARGLPTCLLHALAVYNALTVCHCAACEVSR